MHLFRLLTLVTVLLSLPSYGLATAAHGRACDGQSHTMGANHGAMKGDCCPDVSTRPSGQKAPCQSPDHSDACGLCKAGSSCKSPQTYPPVFISVTASSADRQFNPDRSFAAMPSPCLEGLLRPPSLI